MDSPINPKRQPGDIILDRYMPDATPEEQDDARENLYAFAAVILRICERVHRERMTALNNESSTPGKVLPESENAM